MTFSAKVGSFARNTTTGNQAITGLGFQPKIVFFYGFPATADGSSAHVAAQFGVGISSSDRREMQWGYKDAATTVPINYIDRQNTRCIKEYSSSGAIQADADFVSHDADGFTVNWTTASAGANLVNYLALGGTDLSNVKAGAFTMPTSTGNQAITGVGFQPDWAIFFISVLSTAETANTNSNTSYSIGFATAASVAAASVRCKDAATSVARSYQRTNKCFAAASDSGVFCEASLVSFDSDGFTLNWTAAHTAAAYVYYIAGRGGQVKVGAFNQATSTGNQGVTGVGFQPAAIMFASCNKASGTSNTANGRLTLGAATSSSARFSVWNGATDAQSTSIADKWLKRDKAIIHATEGTPAIDAEADFVSNDADGFTVNWTTADATAREVLYMAFAGSGSDFSGTGSPSFGATTAAGEGEVSQSGTGAPSIAAVTAAGEGTVTEAGSGNTGSGTPSITAITSAGSGSVEYFDTGSVDDILVPAITISGEGIIGFAATGSPSIGAITASGSGTISIQQDTAAPSIAAITVAGEGTISVEGGEMNVTGTGALTLPAVEVYHYLTGGVLAVRRRRR